MCLSIPVKILSIEGDMARVTAGGAVFTAGIQMIEDAKPGDYILMHAGFAIQKISNEDADAAMKLLDEMGSVF